MVEAAAKAAKPPSSQVITSSIQSQVEQPIAPASPQISSNQPVAGEVEREIWRVFGTKTAVAIAKQESQLDPLVINSIGCCVGVFQIHRYAHASKIPGDTMEEKTSWLQDYRNNIAFARGMYDAQGWSPWEAYTSGDYRKYL